MYHGLRTRLDQRAPGNISGGECCGLHLPPVAVSVSEGAADRVSGQCQADEDFRPRVKTLSALEFLPLVEIVEEYELIEQGFGDDEQEFLAYFEATYIGRRIPAGRRRPLFEHHMWARRTGWR